MKIDNRLSFEKTGKTLKYVPTWLVLKNRKISLVRQTLRIYGERLSEREIKVVKMKYGIDYEACSYTEIGKILGLSRSRVSQIGRLAIFRLGLDGDSKSKQKA